MAKVETLYIDGLKYSFDFRRDFIIVSTFDGFANKFYYSFDSDPVETQEFYTIGIIRKKTKQEKKKYVKTRL